MFAYFNIRPGSPSFSVSDSQSRAFEGATRRFYRSHSEVVRIASLEDSSPDVGVIIQPQYDTDDTINSGNVNPFTSPCMSELDRFEFARSIGASVQEAAALAASVDPVSAPGNGDDGAQ